MAKKITTIEKLAEVIQHTMASKEDMHALRAEMATKEDLHLLEQKMDAGFFAVNRRIDLLHDDISDVPTMREELQDFRQRLERVEQKSGLRSNFFY